MIVAAVQYAVQPGKTDAVLKALRRMAILVKEREPGCRLYQVSSAQDVEDQLLLYEVYENQAALDLHRATPHFAQIIQGEVVPLLASRTPVLYRLEIA